MSSNDQVENVDLVEGFQSLRNDVAKLVATVSQFAQDRATTAGHQVADAVDGAADKILETAADAKSRARSASRDIEAIIEKNPMTALFVAFGIGLSVALLTRSRG